MFRILYANYLERRSGRNVGFRLALCAVYQPKGTDWQVTRTDLDVDDLTQHPRVDNLLDSPVVRRVSQYCILSTNQDIQRNDIP